MRISDWSSDVVSSDLIADDTAGDRGHIRRERIAAPRGEFGRQVRRPVLHTGFVAVDHRTGEIALAEARHRREQLGEILVEWERADKGRVGHESVRTCRTRWWQTHVKQKKIEQN